MNPRPMSGLWWVPPLVLGASVAACDAIMGLDPDRQVRTTGPVSDGGAIDAAGEAGPGGPDWACMNDPVPPTPAGSLQLKLLLNDTSTAQSATSFAGTPVAGASVRSCALLDFTCADPISSATTDDAGAALITVPGAFDGYFEIRATNFTPTILSRSPQFASEAAANGLINEQLLALGASLVGVTVDPSLAIALVTALDCGSSPASGVVFTVAAPGPEEKLVYLANNLPSTSATQTDAIGSAIIFNVPVGTITVAAYIAANQRPIRTVSTLTRMGWITFIQPRTDQSRGDPLSGNGQ
jgi:hypothetical protein